MSEFWPDPFELLADAIRDGKDATTLHTLARKLREYAEEADARGIELALDAKDFIMQSITEKVQ